MPYHNISPDRAEWRHEYLRHPEGVISARFAPFLGLGDAAHRYLHHAQFSWSRVGLTLCSYRIRLADRDEPIEAVEPDPAPPTFRRRWFGLKPPTYLQEPNA